MVVREERHIMKIVVISDVENSLRRQHIEGEISNVGVNFTFFDAIMANRMELDDIASKALPNTFLTTGEIRCALSHLGVFERFLASDERSVVILEDDIYFTGEFTENRINEICEFVESSNEPRVVALQKSIYHNKCVKEIDESLRIYSSLNLFGTYGYIVNRKAAENIIGVQSPICFEIDAFKFYYWLQKCNLYCLDKNLVLPVAESEIPSTIRGRENTKPDELTKSESFRQQYNKLSFKDKLICNWRRFKKALHKPFESLDY